MSIAPATLTISILLGLVVALGALGRAHAAQPNQLQNGSVTPGSGLTTTTFTFSVDYTSTSGTPASTVSAIAGGITVPMVLVPGTSAPWSYRGNSLLPTGSWPVTFQATAPKGNPPTLAGPTVVVTGPAVTPAPTPAPTPVPTVTPSPLATPTGVASPSSSIGVPATAGEASPSGSSLGPVPAGSSAGSPDGPGSGSGGDGTGGTPEDGLAAFLTGGLAAIGLLAAVGFTAVWRDRRRQPIAVAPSRPLVTPPGPVTTRRRPSTWERDYALQDEPIGTVEPDAPEELAGLGPEAETSSSQDPDE